MKLLVAVVSYRSAGMVCDLLDSLADECRAMADVLVRVGDNGSGDDSVEILESHVRELGYGDFAEVIDLGRNGGFAWGNNRLIEGPLNAPETERPDYVLLLNPDTLATHGCLGALRDFLDAHPDAAMAGSQLIDPGPDPAVQTSAFRFQGFLSEIDDGLRFGPVSKLLGRFKTKAPHPERPDAPPYRCDWVAGASLMVRREVFETIGLMDEAYFLYFEEEDFCKRAADAGFTCWYVPSSRVVHLVGATSGVTNKRDATKRLPTYWFEARKRYFLTHHGTFKAWLIDVARLVSFGLWRLRRRLQRKPDEDPERFAGDLASLAWTKRSDIASPAIPVIGS